MTHGSLFSGIGGFDLAAQEMGWRNVFNCEINKFCQKVLKKHFPHARTYTDIRETDFTSHRGGCNVLSGGFPCQPFSEAGKKQGTGDNRYLWPEMLRAIGEIQPDYLVGENVPGLLSWNDGAVYRQICADLEDKGYEVCPIVIPAYAVGKQHERKRVWFIGRRKMGDDPDAQGRVLGEIPNTSQAEGTRNSAELLGDGLGLHWYETISRIHGNLNGISRRMDGHRNAGLGNAIVPFLAYQIFKTIQAIENSKHERNHNG